MALVIATFSTSLDGFIADPGVDVDVPMESVEGDRVTHLKYRVRRQKGQEGAR